MSISQEVLGRSITRAEALRIAREILEQAERERLIFAEYEAARGIQWEDHSSQSDFKVGAMFLQI